MELITFSDSSCETENILNFSLGLHSGGGVEAPVVAEWD